MSPATKFCENCNAALPEDAVYCKKCGQSLASLDVSEESTSETPNQELQSSGDQRTNVTVEGTRDSADASDGEADSAGKMLKDNEVNFCPYCGADVVENEQFCYHCGKDVTRIRGHARTPAAAPALSHDDAERPTRDSEVAPQYSPPARFVPPYDPSELAAPQTKFCKHCGAKLGAEALFCRKCGTHLTGGTTERAAPMQRVADQRGDVLNESYRRSGHTVLEPFQKTVVNGIECFTGKTRHPNGHPLEIKVYLADSYENAQRFKEQLSSGYQAHGYVTQEDKLDTWMGVFGSTLISVVAEQTSALGVPTTMVVSTPL